MFTWLYDAQGGASAILDEFCIRSAAGEPVAWVFGLSVFSLKGEHIGWFENGVFFDVDNLMLGFIPGTLTAGAAFPQARPAPPLPSFPKRPQVPALRARLMRQPRAGWSAHGLADYFDAGTSAPIAPAATFVPAAGAEHGAINANSDTPH